MGEARRRGTPEQRQQEGEAKRFAREMEYERRRAERWAAMTPQQREMMLITAGLGPALSDIAELSKDSK